MLNKQNENSVNWKQKSIEWIWLKNEKNVYQKKVIGNKH